MNGKRVLVRAGFDVPARAGGGIADAFRIDRTLPTLRSLLRRRCSLVLLAHRGQPHGVRKTALSLRPVATYLASALRRPVAFRTLGAAMPDAPITLLENLRFEIGEEKAAAAYAKRLARLGERYVNDDFSTSHRKHASTAVLPRLLPAYAGLNLLAEMQALDRLRDRPRSPFVVVVGGAKIADKLAAVHALLQRADAVLIGGAVACTLYNARRIAVGKSFVERAVPRKELLAFLKARSVVLPEDFTVGTGLEARAREVPFDAIPPSSAAYDIGPAAIKRFAATLRTARTVFWSGPMGFAEHRQFMRGTKSLMAAIPRSAWSVVGGGDTVRFVTEHGLGNRFRFLSTGGTALLAYVAGERLPGIEALRR